MKLVNQFKRMQAGVVLTGALLFATGTLALAQDYPPPPSFSQPELDNLVSRIALYPDPLLAQIFAAASFPDQIPEAARWANQYRNLRGEQLAQAIYESSLQFDPAVQALIPFPSVLDMMARDLNWTSDLGNAVLADRPDVLEAVQRMRRAAEQYGYLRSSDQMRVVDTGAAVEIMPVNPSLIYVPVYDPYVVYAPPRPGFFIGGGIGFGPCYSIGAFSGWGWGGGFNWYNRSVIVNNVVWGRTWYNRGAYIHNYGNWDRGAWRNGYNPRGVTIVNNRTVYQNNTYRNDNAYSNRGANTYGRGAQAGYGQNVYSNYGNYNRGGAVAPNANYGRNAYSGSRGSNTAVQNAPAPPSAGYGRGAYSNYGAYNRGAQSVPVTPSSNYGRAYSNSGSFNRGAQAAPVAPSTNYGRNSYSGSRYQSAPSAPQARSFSGGGGGFSGGGHGNPGGRSERSSGRR